MTYCPDLIGPLPARPSEEGPGGQGPNKVRLGSDATGTVRGGARHAGCEPRLSQIGVGTQSAVWMVAHEWPSHPVMQVLSAHLKRRQSCSHRP